MENYLSLSKDEFINKYAYKTFRNNEIDNGFIQALIHNQVDFSISATDLSQVATRVEKIIETSGYSCRVYTENRAAAMGAAAFSGILGVAGLASAVGIAVHNLVTYNPDWEIGKNMIDKQINVTFKKERTVD